MGMCGWWAYLCQRCTAQMGNPGCILHDFNLSHSIPFSQPATYLANLSHLLQWIRPLSHHCLWELFVTKTTSRPKGKRAQEDEELTPMHSQDWYWRKLHLNGAVKGNRNTMPLQNQFFAFLSTNKRQSGFMSGYRWTEDVTWCLVISFQWDCVSRERVLQFEEGMIYRPEK